MAIQRLIQLIFATGAVLLFTAATLAVPPPILWVGYGIWAFTLLVLVWRHHHELD